MVVIGSLLFVVGYAYTRRQAEYSAAQNALVKPIRTKTPMVLPLKTLPAFAFRSDKSFLSSN